MNLAYCIIMKLALIETDFGIELLEALVQQNPGGITKLVTSNFFEYRIEGEEVICTEEMLSRIKSDLGPVEIVNYKEDYRLESAVQLLEPANSQVLEYLKLRM